MFTLKTAKQIGYMKKAGEIVANCHIQLRRQIQPGITTWELNRYVEDYLLQHGASPAQKGYKGYPFATCASVNDVVCHGFPDHIPLQNGDIVKIDFVAEWNGWLADSAWSYAVGDISDEARRLLRTTKEALYEGIKKAAVGKRIGDISHAVQSHAESRGYAVVRDFVGHAIGQSIHEKPLVPHVGTKGKGPRLREGMVITIEPMLTTGSCHTIVQADGWTAKTADGSLSAQYEHTVAITANGPLILTDQDG